MTAPDPDLYGVGAYYGPWVTFDDIEVVLDGSTVFDGGSQSGVSWNQYAPAAPDPGSTAGYLESAWLASVLGYSDDSFTGQSTGENAGPYNGPGMEGMHNLVHSDTMYYDDEITTYRGVGWAPGSEVWWNAHREPRGIFGGGCDAGVGYQTARLDALVVASAFHHWDPYVEPDNLVTSEWDGEATVLKAEIAHAPFFHYNDDAEIARCDMDDALELRVSAPGQIVTPATRPAFGDYYTVPWLTPDLWATTTLLGTWDAFAGDSELSGSTDWIELPSYFTDYGWVHLCTTLNRQGALPSVAVGHEGENAGWGVNLRSMWALRYTIRPARRRYILSRDGGSQMRPGARRDAVVFHDAR